MVTPQNEQATRRRGRAVAQKDDKGWEQVVRDQFPAFTVYLDRPEVFGTQISDILRRAVKEKWWKNPDNGYAKMKAAVEATAYYQNTSSNARAFDSMTKADQDDRTNTYRTEVVKYIGGINVPSDAITQIARDAARFGFAGEALSNYVYSRALAKTSDNYQYGQSAAMILAGGKAEELRADARSFFSTVSDVDIEDYLTGKKTRDDFRNAFRVRAKGQYQHLAEQLDANMTMEDIAKDYMEVASSVLEKRITSVNMTDPKFLESIASRDESGNYRQMNIGEWIKKIKTDRRYGYQYTKAANDDARELARSIARSFGATYG